MERKILERQNLQKSYQKDCGANLSRMGSNLISSNKKTNDVIIFEYEFHFGTFWYLAKNESV